MDIGWAQELFGRQGQLSSIQVLLEDPGRAAAMATQLDALLPPGLRAEAPRQRSFQVQNMLSAFQLNLTALSMVSLLVGVFLIYNTISASVARRRVEIGILRSIGATRWEVRLLFLERPLFLGLCGIAPGAVGGAGASPPAPSPDDSSLYVLLSIDRAWLSPAQFIVAAVFGSGSSPWGGGRPHPSVARDPVAALSAGGHARSRSRGLRAGLVASVPWCWPLSLIACGAVRPSGAVSRPSSSSRGSRCSLQPRRSPSARSRPGSRGPAPCGASPRIICANPFIAMPSPWRRSPRPLP